MAVWDLLIRGGTLVDPAQSISARRDVAFTGGRVAAVAEMLTSDAAPGMAGDAVVMDLEEGSFTYVDFARNEVKTTRRFRMRHVIRDGRRLSTAQSDLV